MSAKYQRLAQFVAGSVIAAVLSALPATAEEMRATEAQHFVAGKHFSYTCFDGTNGNEPGRGVPTVHPNPNWIEELQVVSIGADARYGEFTGAQTNAITRSGSNRFAGLGSYWTTRPDWTGDNRGSLSPALQAQFRPVEIIDRWDLDAQVGGPLKLDRLWFFAGGERYRNILRPQGFGTVAKTAGEPRNTNGGRTSSNSSGTRISRSRPSFASARTHFDAIEVCDHATTTHEASLIAASIFSSTLGPATSSRSHQTDHPSDCR